MTVKEQLIKKGEARAVTKVARKMIACGLDFNAIVEMTGLSFEEVKRFMALETA